MSEEQKTRPGVKGGVINTGGRHGGGRPRKSVNAALAELAAEGVTEVTAQDVSSAYKMLLNLSLPELGKIAGGDSHAVLLRVVARSLLQGRGLDVVERMLDRAHGKTVNTLSLTAAAGGGQTSETPGVISGITITVVGGVQLPVTNEADLDDIE